MLYYYIAFSYLFLIGIGTEQKLSLWNILLAPITLPILLGRWFGHKF